MPPCGERSVDFVLERWILAGFLWLSRSALWAFDLSVNQTIQQAVVRDSLAQRARIGSGQNSLQGIFECLQDALGCIASNPNPFWPRWDTGPWDLPSCCYGLFYRHQLLLY